MKKEIFVALALSMLLCTNICAIDPAQARGGFGGGGRAFGGGFGGGFGGERSFGGGFGDRGFGDRGFGYGDRGFDRGNDFGGMRSDAYRDFDRSFDHPFDSNRPSAFTSPGEIAPTSGISHAVSNDTGVRNYGTVEHGYVGPTSGVENHAPGTVNYQSGYAPRTSGVNSRQAELDNNVRGSTAPSQRGGLAPTSGINSRQAEIDNNVRNPGAQRTLASDGGFSGVMNRAATRDALANGNWTTRVSSEGLANQANLVRNNFRNYNLFRPNWWANHPNAWWNHEWHDWYPWRWSTWNEWGPWWGIGGGIWPIYYDYGDTITYDDNGNVDYGYNSVCSAADYYQTAQNLANSSQDEDDSFGASAAPVSAPPTPPSASAGSEIPAKLQKANASESGDWKPFGVYSLVQGGQSSSTTLFQLCSNKKGQIKGNYYNCLTNEIQPISGSVDKKIMRACWTVGKDKDVVYDTGVANLLREQSPILVHFSRDKTQQWTLVRLKSPEETNAKAKT